MSVSRRETTVNGNRTELWTCDESAPARRLSAALGRNADAVEKITTSTMHDAEAWLCGSESIDAPDGWEIASVFKSSHGGVALRFNEVDGA